MEHILASYADAAPDGKEWVRRRIAAMCDEHLDRLLNAASVSCLVKPEDPTTWTVARLAQDEYDRRGLIDGRRPTDG